MTEQQNKQYNIYFEKHCRRRGGHKGIELEDLKPLVFTTPLIPENISAPKSLNPVWIAHQQGKSYLITDIEFASITYQ